MKSQMDQHLESGCQFPEPQAMPFSDAPRPDSVEQSNALDERSELDNQMLAAALAASVSADTSAAEAIPASRPSTALPCEMCGQLFNSSLILEHQKICILLRSTDTDTARPFSRQKPLSAISSSQAAVSPTIDHRRPQPPKSPKSPQSCRVARLTRTVAGSGGRSKLGQAAMLDGTTAALFSRLNVAADAPTTYDRKTKQKQPSASASASPPRRSVAGSGMRQNGVDKKGRKVPPAGPPKKSQPNSESMDESGLCLTAVGYSRMYDKAP